MKRIILKLQKNIKHPRYSNIHNIVYESVIDLFKPMENSTL